MKSLGQSNPASNTLTTLYTVPTARKAVSSTIAICNTGDSSARYRVSHAVEGAADTRKQYVFYDVALPAKATHSYTLGMAMAESDVIRVRADSSLVTFNLWGAEEAV